MPTITWPEITFFVLALIGLGRVLQVQSQHSKRLDTAEEWQRLHTATPCTHRSKDWEGEVRSNLGEMKTGMGKINESIDKLRESNAEDRKWLNDTFTEIRVDVATLKATRPEAK